jgi:hypothetical protein
MSSQSFSSDRRVPKTTTLTGPGLVLTEDRRRDDDLSPHGFALRGRQLSRGTCIPAPKSGVLQTGTGFTRRLAVPPFHRLAPRMLVFADSCEAQPPAVLALVPARAEDCER